MLPARIGLASQSSSVDFAALVQVAAALTLQVSRDLAPVWNVTGSVMALQDPDHIDPGIWPVYIVDDLDPGLNGFHQTEHNQPFAMVLAGDTWSLSASHEVLEMLVDPSGNRLVASSAVGIVDNEVQDAAGKFEYLLEICDPSEDQSCAYLIDNVLVSDFYTPNYFDPAGTAGARYSFSGKLTRPRQVLPNGYLSWYNAASNKIQQVRHFGAPEIVDLGTGRPGGGSLTGGRSLRGFVDSMTPPPVALSTLHPGSRAVARLNARASVLATAAQRRGSMYTAAASRLTGAGAPVPASPPPNVGAALAANMARLAVPGVLSVRSGLRSSPRGLTDEPAIVAVASPDRLAAVKAALPDQIDGAPVDVRAASAMQQLRAEHPAAFVAMAAARHELRQPEFADEVVFDGNGQRIDAQAAITALAAAHSHKPRIDYQPPAGATLDAVEEDVTLVLHASPDAGWEQLSAFLGGIRKELVVGMYDFTSAHILKAVEDAMADAERSLTLTLDHPAPNPTRDQTDEETQKALADELGDRFNSAWALTNSDVKAPAWIYPNAYHIKVAVREDDTFWLSSGNWNNSNQPEIDLSDVAAARKIAAGHDRDWHVIATSPSLAAKFRAFLRNDYEVAHKAETGAAVTAALAPAVAAMPEVPAAVLAAGRQPRSFFAAKTLRGRMRIQPLLTPDNYQETVRPLIESARSRFYMQTQYIHPSGRAGDEAHDALIAAVKTLVDNGVDVKLITSEFQTDDWVEKLVAVGIPTQVLRRQNKVHNKGIVVDSTVVMVSSQNWSADGTLRNRDAGLIIHNTEAAAYFEAIFLHDWDHLASAVAAG